MNPFKRLLIVFFATFFCLSFISCVKIDEEGNVELPQITYTVQFDTNGGNSIDSQDVSLLKAAPKPYRSNFYFLGWYLDKTLSTPVIFPLSVSNDMTLYAKWLKTKDYSYCENTSLKCWFGDSYASTYTITPSGFDYDTLNLSGYKYLSITVNYDVYYQKDYDVLWDIGYAGAPKYEVSILSSEIRGAFKGGLTTKKTTQSRSITYKALIVDLIDAKVSLSFSTDNIQNLIYFENIKVTYSCS